MSETAPTENEWKQLYAEAEQLLALAPWEELEEDEVFGVQNPETGQIGFVSIMGSLGEHLSIAVYLGEEALYNFWLVHEQAVSPERILEVPQLQASFEDRNELTRQDRNLIKSLGLKYRGRQAWPMFRSYRPGFVPWYLTAEEARFLTLVLAQTRNVVERLDETPDLLDPPDDITYLVRMANTGKDGAVTWRDQIIQVPPPVLPGQDIFLSREMFEAVRDLKSSKMILEVDFFLTPMRVQEQKDERPYFAYMLLVVDHNSGFIFGSESMGAVPSFADMLAQIPQAFLSVLAKNKMRPRQIQVQTERTYTYLTTVCDQLQIKISPTHFLPLLEEAKSEFFNFLER
ncbi:MAG: hypothetical protein IPM53_11295 [Anaerolineaceae bacterium]|nr:hypothetical protein [Anaerolineaceae bacterium]